MLSEAEQKKMLADQIAAWTAEMECLACQIAAAKGQPVAVVLIEPQDEGYADVVPELIMEDAMRITSQGWPKGFHVTCLNRSN